MRLLAVWITALLTATGLAACSAPGAQSEGAAKLAQDFARAGIVPGEPLPSSLQLTGAPGLGLGSPDERAYACANGNFQVDAQGNLKVAVLSYPEAFPARPGLSIVQVETSTGETIWSLSEEAVTEHYGEPSLEYVEDTNPPPVKTYMYYFRKDRNTYVGIALGFPKAGGKLFSIMVMALTKEEARESEMLDGKHKLYAWPKGI
jgi:hypothetical protein